MAVTIEWLQGLARELKEQQLTPVSFRPKIHVTPMAFKTRPAKRYPRRRAKSEAHFERMNKKWAKRYGVVAIPQIYYMTDRFGGGPTLLVHPLLASQVRATLEAM